MATEPGSPPEALRAFHPAPGIPLGQRRRALLALAGWGAWALTPHPAWAHNRGSSVQLAAAWERQGSFHIGLLSTTAGAGQALQVHDALEVPTRAHGLCVLPGGAVLAAARRPGDWLVCWQPGQGTEPQWLWQDGMRSFNGHVLPSPDGRQIYTTETDAETGRAKRAMHTMDSSLVRLDARTGRQLGQWRLEADPRLSLRHLAWSPDAHTLGIALQAEHDDPALKNAAPVLALFDGNMLRTVAAPEPVATRLQGYGGSMAATPTGWAVSCPRAHGIALFSLQGTWQGLVPLPEACPLAVHGSALWAGGLAASLQNAQSAAAQVHPHAAGLQGARLDNHWIVAGPHQD
ncbi:MAG TPA: DUF1513 domain-containing protein [Acidovorax sp.]|nr:DUF1513 domain-containing protein [Acidovorax sp.]